jgi:hypothetical protein
MFRALPYQKHVTLSECEGPYAKRCGRESNRPGTRQLTAPNGTNDLDSLLRMTIVSTQAEENRTVPPHKAIIQKGQRS